MISSERKLLEDIRKNTGFKALYTQGMSALLASGIITWLKERGRAYAIPPNTPNYTEVQLTLANITLGYNQALDDLILFVDNYLEAEAAVPKQPVMEFGGIDAAIASGNLTIEEADAIRSGNPIPRLRTEHPKTPGKRVTS